MSRACCFAVPTLLRCYVSQVTRKGKSVSPKSSPRKGARSASERVGGSPTNKKVTVPHDYFILRICPCPAETLKDLIAERKWMFRCRNMLLYVTQRLREQSLVGETSMQLQLHQLRITSYATVGVRGLPNSATRRTYQTDHDLSLIHI